MSMIREDNETTGEVIFKHEVFYVLMLLLDLQPDKSSQKNQLSILFPLAVFEDG